MAAQSRFPRPQFTNFRDFRGRMTQNCALKPPLFSMRLPFLLATAAAFACPATAGVDSVVTFNEIHYHPADAQTSGEWIELKNQNSVDVDLSGWRIDGGVDFDFPAGTVIRAGQFLVVAANPAALTAASGVTGVLGPLRNAINNTGERITLKNNNGRRMDEIEFTDRQPWPDAADGSGATLAKRNELQNSELPENWRASFESGGTPGSYNFAEQKNGGTIQTAGNPGPLRRHYRFEGNATDASGNNLTGTASGAVTYSPDVPPLAQSGQCLELSGSSQFINVNDPTHPQAYTIAAWVRPDVVRAQSIIVRTDGSGPTTAWSHQLRMTSTGRFEHYTFDGASKSVIGTTVATAGQWYHVAITARNGGDMRLFVNGVQEGASLGVSALWTGGTRWMIGSNSNSATFWDGRIDELAIWHGAMDASQVGHLATGFRLPADPALTNLALGRSVIAGTGAFPDLPFNGTAGLNDFSAANVTDGSAGDVAGSTYWLGRDGITPENFVLDLGNPVEISSILLRNTHHAQFNDRGTAAFRVLAANEVDAASRPIDPTPILTGTLTTRTVAAPLPPSTPIPADLFTAANGLTPATARYLVFEALSSAYTGSVGLNEIEVFGTALPGGGNSGKPLPPALVISELTPADTASWWIELHNHGASPIDLAGCVIASSSGPAYTFPAGTTLNAGSYLVASESLTAFRPADGDLITLYGRDRRTVIDAVRHKTRKHQLRRPAGPGAGPGEFLAAVTADDITPGAPNRISLESGVVINEIMYHRRPQFLPYTENPEEWIELHNKSLRAIDLSGWTIDDAIGFTFPPNTTLAAGAYLCIANDAAAFTTANPGVPVAGNFSGGLSNRGERIILRDALGNAVDTVFYRDKEPWPLYTDGLGSSLELRNPHADNSLPESWAASDESSRSEWKTYSYTATARTPIYTPTITTSGTTAFHELRMGLLEEGEVLVDDVSVREITTSPTIELIQNGSFSNPLRPVWRVLGNHETSAITDAGGNPALHLRASGPLLYMHNLLETTFKNGTAVVPVVNNREYTVSLRAKWLRGCPWLHTEFYYNKVSKSILLDLPAASGTPGARNSVYTENAGPTFSLQLHAPAVPEAGEPITFSTAINDPDGVASARIFYSVNGAAAFSQLPLAASPDGLYRATIPGQAAGAIVHFYCEATDAAPTPATATWPADGRDARALIKVNEGGATPSKQNLRIITTAADAAELASQVNMMSNRRRGCTIIHNEKEIFYNGKIRLRGSMYSRSGTGTAGQSLTFPADKLFRGTQRTVSVRRSGMNEILVKHTINSAGGLPDNYNDIINIVSFRSDSVGPARMEMERFSNSWLDEFYPEGSDGTQFKLEGIRVPTLTFANGTIPAGNPEGIKNLTTNGMGWVVQLDLADLGTDGGQYRHGFRWLNNFSRNDNARFVQLCRTLSLPVGTADQALAFERAIEPLMDVDEWMRVFAMMSLFGIGDVYSQPPGTVSNISNPHNLNFYMPPTPDGRISAIPWDWNFVFSQAATAPLTGDKNIQKVINRPRFRRLFLGHLKHLADTAFNATYLNPWLAHYSEVTGESYTGYAGNITSRVTYVRSQINAQIPPVAFTITTNGGNDFSTDTPSTIIEGDGWVDVRSILLNNSPASLPVTWTDNNSWRISVPLAAGENAITLTATDLSGKTVGNDTIRITNTSAIVPASAANLAISKIHYNPVAPAGEFVELMNISATATVDLSGCSFTDGIRYDFPPNSLMAPLARLVIPASAFLEATALSNAGETLTLSAPGGTPIRSVSYSDEAPWPTEPDGSGPSLVLIQPTANPDHNLPQNWRPSTSLNGSPGTADSIPFTGNPAGDDDSDGWNNLLEYALGPNPQPTITPSPDGTTFSIPRIPGADDAAITGEVSPSLASWSPAEFIGSTATSLTFRIPDALRTSTRLYLRAKVQLR